MNWNERYASDTMWNHMYNHVHTPAHNYLVSLRLKLNPPVSPTHEEILGCTSCCHPEYMSWEHEQIFGDLNSQDGLGLGHIDSELHDMMRHQHIDNHIQAGSTCPRCARKEFGTAQ
jgi:hypothetical protein